MKDLEGRTAVITGAGSGLGRATALELAKAGVNLVSADIDAAGAEETARAAQALGVAAVGVRCDVAEADAFQALRGVVDGRFGHADILMNNVGVLTGGRPEDIPVAEWERVLNINLMSVIRSHDAFLRGFLERGAGHIVNVASLAGLYPYAFDRAPYAASKAAIISISETLALYARPRGVGVTVVCPGPMPTNVIKSLRTWGAPLGVRGPGADFQLMPPQEAAVMTLDAIRGNRFMVVTHPQAYAPMRRRLEDWDGFIAEQAAEIHAALNYDG
jgi:NAD(P)-dependent dehydrogenase (short-subunit alcohol dehydrogenase family)